MDAKSRSLTWWRNLMSRRGAVGRIQWKYLKMCWKADMRAVTKSQSLVKAPPPSGLGLPYVLLGKHPKTPGPKHLAQRWHHPCRRAQVLGRDLHRERHHLLVCTWEARDPQVLWQHLLSFQDLPLSYLSFVSKIVSHSYLSPTQWSFHPSLSHSYLIIVPILLHSYPIRFFVFISLFSQFFLVLISLFSHSYFAGMSFLFPGTPCMFRFLCFLYVAAAFSQSFSVCLSESEQAADRRKPREAEKRKKRERERGQSKKTKRCVEPWQVRLSRSQHQNPRRNTCFTKPGAKQVSQPVSQSPVPQDFQSLSKSTWTLEYLRHAKS